MIWLRRFFIAPLLLAGFLGMLVMAGVGVFLAWLMQEKNVFWEMTRSAPREGWQMLKAGKL